MAELTATLVIPCYNEGSNLTALAKRCIEVCAADPLLDVLLVDNGSVDDSPAIFARGFGHPRVGSIRVKVNQGYGFGILSGLQAAGGDVIGWTHADLQTDPMDALAALAPFRQAAAPTRVFVKGRRTGRPLRDMVFTWGMTAFASLMLNTPLSDINAQPTFFHRDFFAGWHNPPLDFSLDLYAYVQAVRAGLDIHRVPVHFGPRLSGTGHNESLANKLKYSKRSAHYILELRRRTGTAC